MQNKYEVIERKRKVKVRDLEIEFIEKVKINTETGEEEYDRNIEIENAQTLYNIYRKQKNMNSIDDIIKIREKYDLSQSDYSLILGFGKVTIHRYENGMLQTEANDIMITLSKDPKNMEEMLLKNKEKISYETYSKLMCKLIKLKTLETHKITDISKIKKKDDFKTISVKEIAQKLLYLADVQGNRLSQLGLQKLLYYIQGVAFAVYKKPAFEEEIYNWKYGPVVKEIYSEYKKYEDNPISCKKDIKTSMALEEIVVNILADYGIYTVGKLIELTHEEDPWLNTKNNEIIEKTKIFEYFEKLYN